MFTHIYFKHLFSLNANRAPAFLLTQTKITHNHTKINAIKNKKNKDECPLSPVSQLLLRASTEDASSLHTSRRTSIHKPHERGFCGADHEDGAVRLYYGNYFVYLVVCWCSK